MDKGTIIRGFTAADLGFILHSRHQYHWHTGYIPPQAQAMPHIGSVISRTLGPKNADMPAFVAIGQTVEGAGEIGTLKAFHTAGFLGTDHGPFLIIDPQDAASAVRPPQGARRPALREPPPAPRAAAGAGTGLSVRRRVPARGGGEVPRRERPAAPIAVGKGVRPLARAKGVLRQVQHRPVRPGVSVGAPSRRGGGALRRGDVRIHSVRLLGHAREWPPARRGHEEDHRPADRPAREATSTSGACSTARWSFWPASSAATL